MSNKGRNWFKKSVRFVFRCRQHLFKNKDFAIFRSSGIIDSVLISISALLTYIAGVLVSYAAVVLLRSTHDFMRKAPLIAQSVVDGGALWISLDALL